MYSPASEAVMLLIVYELEVAPDMLVPFFFHWYVVVPVELTVTENVVLFPDPAQIMVEVGCAVTVGAGITNDALLYPIKP